MDPSLPAAGGSGWALRVSPHAPCGAKYMRMLGRPAQKGPPASGSALRESPGPLPQWAHGGSVQALWELLVGTPLQMSTPDRLLGVAGREKEGAGNVGWVFSTVNLKVLEYK